MAPDPVHTNAPRPNEESSAATPSGSSLAGRLFVVPAIVVTVLICAAIVVVMFGGSAIGQRPTIDDLLKKLESGGGRHTAGVMLLPADREVWQAAQELATRLIKKGAELPAEELEPTAARVTKILRALDAQGPQNDAQQPKQMFLLLALARLGTPTAVETVAGYLTNSNPVLRQFALRGLVEMRAMPEARAQLSRVLAMLEDPASEVQMVACVAVGELAAPGDEAATTALREKLTADREVQWNAALALGRLGSKAGRLVLLNMLDRGFWEKGRVRYQDASETIDRAFTSVEVANYLVAAVEASAELDDADIRQSIDRLRGDPVERVRQAARRARGADPAMEPAKG